MTLPILDAAIVGGGPGGLTTAIYLSRFRRDFVVIDSGNSRAKRIPLSRNVPGFPAGIAGDELLLRMRTQARSFEATILDGEISQITNEDGAFTLRCTAGDAKARSVLLATGVKDRQPVMEDYDRAVALGLIRYCAICDGYEASGRNIAVLGDGDKAAGEALFLKTYSENVTLVPAGNRSYFTTDMTSKLKKSGYQYCIATPRGLRMTNRPFVWALTASNCDLTVSTRRWVANHYPDLRAFWERQLAMELVSSSTSTRARKWRGCSLQAMLSRVSYLLLWGRLQ
jgi:thioredoxin reductase